MANGEKNSQAFPLMGGLDLVTSRLLANPGTVIDAVNFEAVAQGYRRIGGFVPYDGREFSSTYNLGTITSIPGSGPIRGIFGFEKEPGRVIAFRDSVNGLTCQMWYSSLYNGWSLVDLGTKINFTNGSGEADFLHTIITGSTSSAIASVSDIVVTSGSFDANDAAGYIVVTFRTGTFQVEQTSNTSTTTTLIISGPGTSVTLVPGGNYQFTTGNFTGRSGTEKIYGCDGKNPGFEWDGMYFRQINLGVIYPPTYVACHSNHLFFAFRGGSLQHSAIGDPFDWTPLSGAAELGIGQDITGLLCQTQTLAIFGKESISILYGSGSDNWELTTWSGNSGAIAGTIQQMGQAVFMDNAGIRTLNAAQQFGNFTSGTLSLLIEPLIRAKRNAGVIPIASVRVRSSDIYRVFFSDGTGLSVFIADQKAQIMPIDYNKVVRCTCTFSDANGSDLCLFGSDDGFVYRMDAGPSFAGGSIDAYVQFAYTHLKSPDIVKRFHDISIQAEAAPGTLLYVSVGFDYEDMVYPHIFEQMISPQGGTPPEQGAVPSTSVLATRIPGQGRSMSVKLRSASSTDPSFTIHGMTVGYSPRKMAR